MCSVAITAFIDLAASYFPDQLHNLLAVWMRCIVILVYGPSTQIGVAVRIFSTPGFWMELILVYIVTFSVRYLERAVRWLFFPNDDMILAEVEAAQAASAAPRRRHRHVQMGLRRARNADEDHDAPCMA